MISPSATARCITSFALILIAAGCDGKTWTEDEITEIAMASIDETGVQGSLGDVESELERQKAEIKRLRDEFEDHQISEH